jgi:hypothetical protein
MDRLLLPIGQSAGGLVLINFVNDTDMDGPGERPLL